MFRHTFFTEIPPICGNGADIICAAPHVALLTKIACTEQNMVFPRSHTTVVGERGGRAARDHFIVLPKSSHFKKFLGALRNAHNALDADIYLPTCGWLDDALPRENAHRDILRCAVHLAHEPCRSGLQFTLRPTV